MEKLYNIDFRQIDENTTLGKILTAMRPGCTVLECGCATGYMTRLMKERLIAKVYIVEWGQKAFHMAMKYAEGGVCADLMSDDWQKNFNGISFDYIIFADVLEHLREPLTVLKTAVSMLKEDGTVLISVPNVAHNDLLISLYENHWEYTRTGLLDETHVHFFTEESLILLCEEAGLFAELLDYVRIPTFNTEQARPYDQEKEDLYRLLWARANGEAYQFVLKARRIGFACENGLTQTIKTLPPTLPYEARLYVDTGEGFSEETVLKQRYVAGRETIFSFKLPKGAKTLRVDPVEGCGCIVTKLRAGTEDGPLNAAASNGIDFQGSICFFNTDPQCLYTLDAPAERFEITANIELIPKAFMKAAEGLFNKNAECLENLEWRLRLATEEKESAEEALSIARGGIEEIRHKLFAAEERVRDMEDSASWRLTAPLRFVRKNKRK